MNKRILSVLLAAVLVVAAGAIAINMTNKKSMDSNNEQDVVFAQMMIAHHEQAVEMAALAETRTQNAEVRELARKIQSAQEPEIETMKGWLTRWNKPIVTPVSDGQGMESHDMGTVSGSMTSEELALLKASRGMEFDKMFLERMIRHHEGAIEMARTQESAGQYGPAVDLAKKVITDQTAEIGEIKKLQKAIR